MSFSLYNYLDYKLAIKDRVKEMKKSKPKFSVLYLSEILGIQYTFLSKVLNSDTHHLNEDQLFIAGQTLEFLHDEIDYLLLLRSYGATSDKNRKNFLFQRISTVQKQNNLSVNSAKPQQSQFDDDMKYLLSYHNIIIHVALSIKEVQKNPYMLSTYLGLDFSQIREALIMLDRMGQIEYDQKSNQIKKVQNTRTHFGKDHPLTRTHQLVMKTFLNQKSFGVAEEKKENMFFTFTTDKNGFDKIKKKIKEFAGEIQKTTFESEHTGVYQLNLDFLEVFNHVK